MSEAPTLLWLHENFVSAKQGGNSRATLGLSALLEAGWKIELICTTRSYLGEVYGAGEPQIESEGLLRIHRIAGSEGYSRPKQYIHFCRAAFRYAQSLPSPDLVFASSPSLPQVAPALWLAARNRLPLVLEVRDLWPAFLEEGRILDSRFLLAAMRVLEELAYRSASEVVSVSPAFNPYLESMGVDRHRLTVAPTGADPTVLEDASPRSLEQESEGRPKRDLVVLYAGSFNQSYGLEILESAIDRSADLGIRWLLAGAGDRSADIAACANRNPHAQLLGLLSKNELRSIFNEVDLGISIHAPWPLLGTTISGKLFDYLAAGIPVLNLAPGQMAEILELSGGGWQVARDPGALLAELARISRISEADRTEVGQMGKRWIRRHMHGGTSARRIATAVDRAWQGGRRLGLARLATDAAMACLHLVTDRSRKNLRSLYDDGVRAETIRSSLAHFLEEPAAESDRMLEMPRLLSD